MAERSTGSYKECSQWPVPRVRPSGSHAISHFQRQCLAIGMDSVIVKPFDAARFYAAIEDVASKLTEV